MYENIGKQWRGWGWDNSGSERQRAISIDSMQIGDEKKVDSADCKRREHHKME